MSDRIVLTPAKARELRGARKRLAMTQYRLAELTGLTRPKVKRIEKREIETVAKSDLARLENALRGAGRRPRPAGQGVAPVPKGKSGNGASERKTRKSTSGRAQVTSAPSPPALDSEMRSEVDRRLRESVLDVMRDVIGDSGRVLVEKHKLHDVTLGELFQVDA